MKELLEKILAGGGKELAGLELEGVIPIRQELINEALTEGLKQGVPGSLPTAKAPDSATINALLAHVKKAEIKASEGRLTLSFHVKVD